MAGVPTTAGVPGVRLRARRDRRRWCSACSTPAPSASARPTSTSSPPGWSAPGRPYGACRNPIDPEYIAGGSSSGSAVAVATGVVTFALGTDTAGSGRVPAALYGIVGLKPTPGRRVERRRRAGDAVVRLRLGVHHHRGRRGDACSTCSRRSRRRPWRLSRPPRLGVPDADRLVRRRRRRAPASSDALDARRRRSGCTVEEIDAHAAARRRRCCTAARWSPSATPRSARSPPRTPTRSIPAVAEIVRRAGEYRGSEVVPRARHALGGSARGRSRRGGRDRRAPRSRPSRASRRSPRRSPIRSGPAPGARPAHRVREPARPGRGRGAVGVRASGVPFGVSRRRSRRAPIAELLALAPPRFTGESLASTAATSRRGRTAPGGRRRAPHRPAAQPPAHRPRRGRCARPRPPRPSTACSRSTPRRRSPACCARRATARDRGRGVGARRRRASARSSPPSRRRSASARCSSPTAREVTGFLCEPLRRRAGARHHRVGGWRAYLAGAG